MARADALDCFEVSGEILTEDMIRHLAAPDCRQPGCSPDDFKAPNAERPPKVEEEVAAAWDLLTERWESIRSEIEQFDTERLRRRWIMPLLNLLDLDPAPLRGKTVYGGEGRDQRDILFTHRADEQAGNVPIWMLDYSADPDEKVSPGRRRLSPHEHLQEYLDLTDDSWALLVNGQRLRLLHDYHKTLTRNYVELDLHTMIETRNFDAFRAGYRIFHASRFRPRADGKCPLELLRDACRQEGIEVGKELRGQVVKAIEILGNGFLTADAAGGLRRRLESDAGARERYYSALLHLIYRLLFFLYVEAQPWWAAKNDPVWNESYGMTRLRRKAEEATSTGDDAFDLWEGLKVSFRLIRDGCEYFKIHPYGGRLFDDAKLGPPAQGRLRNSDLLDAIRLITSFPRDKQLYRINFRRLQIDALGSVYEALLEYTPCMTPTGRFALGGGAGERKKTGSYYTPPELVAELIKSALIPVIGERMAAAKTKNGGDPKALEEAALLSIRVCDPACGSGAFLLQAMDALAARLCAIRRAGEEPSDLDIREARRDVVTRCIFGVDVNPLAVELCKFTLWLHVAHPELPLSFLDPNIRCGNSLIGIGPIMHRRGEKGDWVRVGLDELEVPDEAFAPVTGDDKKLASALKKANRKEREGQVKLAFDEEAPKLGALHEEYRKILAMEERTPEQVEEKAIRYARFVRQSAYENAKLTADTWCAAFFWPLTKDQDRYPTHETYLRVRQTPHSVSKTLLESVRALAERHRFFHWHLEFPQVFSGLLGADGQDGFDCVLGNPPWERIKLQEQEFFAVRDPAITEAPNKGARQRLIDALSHSNPDLARQFQDAKHSAEAESKFVRASGRFPLTAVGDVNTYALFAEQFRAVIGEGGRAGLVCPTGIATDDSTKAFFGELVATGAIATLYGFENEDTIFPGVHHAYKFCLLTISGAAVKSESADLTFLCRSTEHCRDTRRRFALSAEDFALLNPNTHTCPVFRTRADAQLTKAIYHRIPVLVNEGANTNPWNVTFARIFDMNKQEVLDLCKTSRSPECLKMYEAKMIHQYDHRFGSYEDRGNARGFTALPDTPHDRYRCAQYEVMPFYWVAQQHVEDKLLGKWNRAWLIAYRDITSNALQRTSICAVLPLCGTDFTLRLAFPNAGSPVECFVAGFNSLVFDYVCREAVATTHMSDYITKQLPMLAPSAYCGADIAFIAPRVLELVYTAWDMKPFAEDMGYDGAPFKWDEDRRAILRAELDAYYARLYGLTRKQLRYMLDPHGLSERELEDILDPWEDPTCSGPHLLPEHPAVDFPGETFRVLKEKEIKQHGEYRTRRLVLAAWARLDQGTEDQYG
jgi:hypothetical protein